MFNVLFDEDSNRINLFNFSPHKVYAPIKEHVESRDYNSILIELGFLGLKPINDYEDFIFTFGSDFPLKEILYDYDDLSGRSFGDLCPISKKFLYPIFKRILKESSFEFINIYFYEKCYLNKYLEVKLFSKDNELFFIFNDKSNLIKSFEEDNDNSEKSNLKFYVQDDIIFRLNNNNNNNNNNNILDFLFSNLSTLSLDEINKKFIIHNDTGFEVNFTQIINSILNKEETSIIYNLSVIFEDKIRYFQVIARYTIFNNKPAVSNEIIKELKNFDGSEVFNLVQDYAKSTFFIYDVYSDTYIWNNSLEELLETEIPAGSDLREVIFPIILEEDFDNVLDTESKLSLDNPMEEFKYRIKTPKGNIKYIHVIVKLVIHEGEIVKWLNVFKDVTSYNLQNQQRMALEDTLKDVQESASISIHYMDREGNYHWTPQTYNLIEREPKESDRYHHIIFDLLVDGDKKRYKNDLVNLKPNEFLGHNTYKIITELGNVKYIQVDSRKIYNKEGKFLRRSSYTIDITDSVLKSKELSKLNSTVDDLQSAANICIHYLGADGKHVWSPETYNLLEREPRESDKDSHIILDLAYEEDQKLFDKFFREMKPNEFLGKKNFWVTLENGKHKLLQVDARKHYDEKGNFIQKNGYAMDITDIFNRNQELLSLSATVDDVQEAANISVHYLSNNGKYYWTHETYNIIERERRLSDDDYHIIMDLLSDEDKGFLTELMNNLGPNEFLGNYTFPITTENGKKKYILFNARPIFDEDGNFFRRSEFAQDVTSQVEYEQALIEADNEKTILVKEVHHRVKNNLQLITSFISLEERFHNEDPSRIIEITKNRLISLALIHERIYNEENMSIISFKEFIADFDNKLLPLSNHQDIHFKMDIDEDLTLVIDYITPMVLMINELTTNSFKYAFNDNQEYKEIFKSAKLYEENGQKMCKCHYKDNGVGLPDNFDLDASASLGWTIVKSLSRQLDGEYEVFNDDGFNFVLRFPIYDEGL